MIFYYIRHGEPIYNPDSLTPLGIQQAEALAKRLALCGLDKIYASTSNRAIMTAKPTCELLKKDYALLDFANERYAWRELSVENEDGNGRSWVFSNPRTKHLLCDKSVRDLGDRWFDHPEFRKLTLKRALAASMTRQINSCVHWDMSTSDTPDATKSINPITKE